MSASIKSAIESAVGTSTVTSISNAVSSFQVVLNSSGVSESTKTSILSVLNVTLSGVLNAFVTAVKDASGVIVATGRFTTVTIGGQMIGATSTTTDVYNAVMGVTVTTISAVTNPNDIRVSAGTGISSIAFPSSVVVILTNGATDSRTVSWSSNSSPAYNSSIAGTYTFTGSISGTNITATQKVIVESQTNNNYVSYTDNFSTLDTSKWNVATGNWSVNSSQLVTTSPLNEIWYKQPTGSHFETEFDVTPAIGAGNPDFRINICSNGVNNSATNSIGSFYQILIPWGGGDSRIDYFNNGFAEHILTGINFNYPSQYHVKLSYNSGNLNVYINSTQLINHTLTKTFTGDIFMGLHDGFGGVKIKNFVLRVYNDTVPQSGSLIGWWKFDEGTGTTATDSSGNNVTLTAQNTTWGDGINGGKALYFNGVSSSAKAAVNSAFSVDKVTLSAWIKSTGNGNYNPRIVAFGPAGTAYQSYSMILKDTTKQLWFYCSEDPNAFNILANKSITPDGLWHHVAVAYDGASTNFYIDSILDKTISGSRTIPKLDNGVLQIGYSENGSPDTDRFQGAINDVRIYNYALSASEISSYYNSTKPAATTQTEVATQTVTPTGGSVVVNKPGDPLNGLQIDIPQGAYTENKDFKIAYEPSTSISVPNTVNLSPVISVENGGTISSEPLAVKIPFTSNSDYVPMAFYYDDSTGRLEAIPTVVNQSGQAVALTKHFSKIVLMGTKPYYSDLLIDTLFKVKENNWQFANIGSYISTDGMCLGMCLTEQWYFEKFNRTKLYGILDTNNLNIDKGYDDALGFKFTSVIQQDIGSWTVFSNNINSQLEKWFSSDKNTYDNLAAALSVTKRPQILGLMGSGGYKHAVLAYKISQGVIYIADPNYPDDETKQIIYSNGKFSPYFGRVTSSGSTITYDRFYYYGEGAFINKNTLEKRWSEVQNKTIGYDKFPTVNIMFKNSDGTYVPVGDDFFVNSLTVTLKVSSSAGGASIYKVYSAENNSAILPTSPAKADEVTFNLPVSGENNVGISVVASDEWLDFRNIKFRYLSSSPQITFPPTSSYKWIVSHYGKYFATNTFLDSEGLHLKITNNNGQALCSEVESVDNNFGYGKYKFRVVKKSAGALDKRAVLGLFTFKGSGTSFTPQENEIDIEFSNWNGEYGSYNAHHVFQYRKSGSESALNDITPKKFIFDLSNETDNSIEWTTDTNGNPKIVFTTGTITSTYENDPRIPKYEPGIKVLMNLWMYYSGGTINNTNLTEQEVVIKNFEYIPYSCTPAITSPTIDKSSVAVNESFNVTVKGKNNGIMTAKSGGITIEVRNAFTKDVEVSETHTATGSDASIKSVWWKGETLGTGVAAQYLHIEPTWNGWAGGAEKTLTATITPRKAGTYDIYAKMNMTADGTNYMRDPAGSGTNTDHQNESTVKVGTVTVGGGGTTPTGETITLDLGGGVTLEMVKINAAGKSFQMGSPSTEQDRYPDEGPVHTVSFTKDYYMGKYELTQAQWMKIYGSWPGGAPSSTYGVGDNNPAYFVSWNDICNTGGFLEKLNTLKPSGYSGFRLPTEAEWEYAARAGTQTRFYWGDDSSYILIGDYAWYTSNSGSKTHPAGEKLPNSFGLYDMSGNVWEWCSDWYGSYGSSAVSDPTGPAAGSSRVNRGGGWGSGARDCRSANRSNDFPSCRYGSIGFRLALPTGQ